MIKILIALCVLSLENMSYAAFGPEFGRENVSGGIRTIIKHYKDRQQIYLERKTKDVDKTTAIYALLSDPTNVITHRANKTEKEAIVKAIVASVLINPEKVFAKPEGDTKKNHFKILEAIYGLAKALLHEEYHLKDLQNCFAEAIDEKWNDFKSVETLGGITKAEFELWFMATLLEHTHHAAFHSLHRENRGEGLRNISSTTEARASASASSESSPGHISDDESDRSSGSSTIANESFDSAAATSAATTSAGREEAIDLRNLNEEERRVANEAMQKAVIALRTEQAQKEKAHTAMDELITSLGEETQKEIKKKWFALSRIINTFTEDSCHNFLHSMFEEINHKITNEQDEGKKAKISNDLMVIKSTIAENINSSHNVGAAYKKIEKAENKKRLEETLKEQLKTLNQETSDEVYTEEEIVSYIKRNQFSPPYYIYFIEDDKIDTLFSTEQTTRTAGSQLINDIIRILNYANKESLLFIKYKIFKLLLEKYQNENYTEQNFSQLLGAINTQIQDRQSNLGPEVFTGNDYSELPGIRCLKSGITDIATKFNDFEKADWLQKIIENKIKEKEKKTKIDSAKTEEKALEETETTLKKIQKSDALLKQQFIAYKASSIILWQTLKVFNQNEENIKHEIEEEIKKKTATALDLAMDSEATTIQIEQASQNAFTAIDNTKEQNILEAQRVKEENIRNVSTATNSSNSSRTLRVRTNDSRAPEGLVTALNTNSSNNPPLTNAARIQNINNKFNQEKDTIEKKAQTEKEKAEKKAKSKVKESIERQIKQGLEQEEQRTNEIRKKLEKQKIDKLVEKLKVQYFPQPAAGAEDPFARAHTILQKLQDALEQEDSTVDSILQIARAEKEEDTGEAEQKRIADLQKILEMAKKPDNVTYANRGTPVRESIHSSKNLSETDKGKLLDILDNNLTQFVRQVKSMLTAYEGVLNDIQRKEEAFNTRITASNNAAASSSSATAAASAQRPNPLGGGGREGLLAEIQNGTQNRRRNQTAAASSSSATAGAPITTGEG